MTRDDLVLIAGVKEIIDKNNGNKKDTLLFLDKFKNGTENEEKTIRLLIDILAK